MKIKPSLIFKAMCIGAILALNYYPLKAKISNQESMQSKEIALPIDPQVKIGKLPNGFTYYIRKNTEPKDRVVMYLVNKVGSILEQDNELGLAHFMEHMSFKGTSHFPENELINYLQKSGVEFGSDLNAYTGFDETIYQLPLPTDDPTLLKNGFQIMRDWANSALIDSIALEKERGVILEEKRLRTNVQTRIQKQLFPTMLNNSHYAERQPIGEEKILTTFPRQRIANFYRRWYRPDLQALIVVGDIDVANTEEMIKNLFSDLKNPTPEVARTKYEIPLLNQNHFAKVTDKELTSSSIQIIFKSLKDENVTREGYKTNLICAAMNFILAERFSDLSKQPNSPLLGVEANYGSLLANLQEFSFQVEAKPKMFEQAFKTSWAEVVRAQKLGFTKPEIDRFKQAYMKDMENNYNERDKTESSSYVEEYVRNFLENEPIPGMEYEYHLVNELLSEITLDDVNEFLRNKLHENNRDIFVVGPEKEKDQLPSEALILSWMNDVKKSSINNVQQENLNETLLSEKPATGKIVSETKDNKLGVTTWILSNGVRVFIKPTDFKNDEILFNATSPGGTSLYDNNDFFSATIATNYINYSGLAKFDQAQLRKILTGKQVSVSPFINERYEGISGQSDVSDLETAMQLVYLYFTQPRSDKERFNQELERSKTSLANRGDNPNAVFADTLAAVMSNYNIRRTGPSIDKINRIDLDRAFDIYKERFADASDFTFTFVGNINVEKAKNIIAQYLGSLPSTHRKEEARDLGIRTAKGKIERTVNKGVEAKSTVVLLYTGKYV